MQSSLDTNYVWVNHSKYHFITSVWCLLTRFLCVKLLLSSLSCFLVLTFVRPQLVALMAKNPCVMQET